jgi:exopolysaccharide/PEP-CTERM locus tyrosine autokinase
MGRVEEALRRLREQKGQPRQDEPRQDQERARPAERRRTAVPVASKKKVEVGGTKHHVSQDDLIAGGLLAPLDIAVPVTDEFRRIKRPLIANWSKGVAEKGHMNIIMVTSALPGAGKTFCSVNLAASLSLERELNVLLVDADVAKPHISSAFGAKDAPGLIDLLLDESLELSDTLLRTDLNDIQLLPAGRRHPQATELLASERMKHVVDELAERYPDRIIILDSPPLLLTSEAQALAGQVGQIALIVEAGTTTQQQLNLALETLNPDKAINLILNKSRRGTLGGYYGDYYGGKYALADA